MHNKDFSSQPELKPSLGEQDLNEAEIRQRIPVFVNSFNQLFYLRDTVNWFHKYGFRNVTILDNASTFPDLIDYLNGEECLSKAKVEHLKRNFGPQESLIKAASDESTDEGFIFTDPDLKLPDPPAANMLKTMFKLGKRHECPKVGLALSLDPSLVNVDLAWLNGHSVKDWEHHFWRSPVENEVYRAAVDTTFFLYVPQLGHHSRFVDYKLPQPRIPALRCSGEGFIALHRPWLISESPPKAEVDFYRDRASKHSTLSQAQSSRPQSAESTSELKEPDVLRPWPARREVRRKLIPLFLEAVLSNSESPISLVQVGAHDGLMSDPVHQYIIENKCKSLLIEPHPVYFSDLQNRHRERDHVSVVNVGISSEDGKSELFHLDEAFRKKYPKAARGCASLNRQRMFDALERVNSPKGNTTPEEHIASTTVEMRRLDELLIEHGLESFDILVVDVEGHELEVLDSTRLDKAGLKLAIVECNGPDISKEAEVVERLNAAGLSVIRSGDDLVGFVRGTLRFPVEILLPLAGLQLL